MKKKILSILISILSLCTFLFTFTACENGNSSDADLEETVLIMSKAI